MPLDPYSACPCGSGKKLKFCCNDLKAEMEKIDRMLAGKQSVACLDHIKNLLVRHPDRASLLGIRAMLEVELQRYDDAELTISKLLEHNPKNLLGLTERVILTAQTEEGQAAVGPLHAALALVDRELPNRLYSAIGDVATALLEDNYLAAGRAHLILQASVSQGKDEEAMRACALLNADRTFPLLLKDERGLVDCPDNVPWKADFEKAKRLVQHFAWPAGQQAFQRIVEKHAAAAEAWLNLAKVRSWLADGNGAVEALRKYASLDIPFDNAVEAEALAGLLHPDDLCDFVDCVNITHPILDMNVLEANLNQDKCASRFFVDASQFKDSDQPPPRSVYVLFNCPVPDTAENLRLEDVPFRIAQLFLFGKETDRPARLEVLTLKDENFASMQSIIKEIGRSAIGEPATEAVYTNLSAIEQILRQTLRLPDDVSDEQRVDIQKQLKRDTIFNRLPDVPLNPFDGQSLRQLSQDTTKKKCALATMLILEDLLQEDKLGFDTVGLREHLGLPNPPPIDPEKCDLAGLPVIRYPRLSCEKLSDDDLVKLYQSALVLHAADGLRRLGAEVVKRESLDNQLDRLAAYRVLLNLETEPSQRLELVGNAIALAEQQNQPSGLWHVDEMAICLVLREMDRFEKTFHHVTNHHIDEPNVRERVTQLLIETGLINPDGTVRQPAPSSTPPTSDETDKPSEIWTPDKERSASDQKKSSLWVPE